MASPIDNTLALRKRVESGEINGPRILTVGDPVWTREPIYARTFLAEHKINLPDTTTPEQARALVAQNAAKAPMESSSSPVHIKAERTLT